MGFCDGVIIGIRTLFSLDHNSLRFWSLRTPTLSQVKNSLQKNCPPHPTQDLPFDHNSTHLHDGLRLFPFLSPFHCQLFHAGLVFAKLFRSFRGVSNRGFLKAKKKRIVPLKAIYISNRFQNQPTWSPVFSELLIIPLRRSISSLSSRINFTFWSCKTEKKSRLRLR